MSDLFTVADERLHRAGQDTSAAALAKTGRSRATRQRNVYEFLARHGDEGAIPEELAALMGEELIDVRRCFSVLKKTGAIISTGELRKNLKGHDCVVYRAVALQQAKPLVMPHRKMRPIGDPVLFGKMMHGIYAHANAAFMEDDSINCAMMEGHATAWARDMAERIRKQAANA